MIHQGCFVTGTDTDAGKTVFASALYRASLLSGRKTAVIKPVQTGVEDGIAPDVQSYQNAVCDITGKKTILALECFRVPCSPHFAAQLESRTIDIQKIVHQIRELQEQGYCVIVEGAGGLWVPLNGTDTILDLIRETALPVLLVFDNRVGCINQVMLSLRELQRQNIPIVGCVSNSVQKDSTGEEIRCNNIETILRLSGVPVLADIPFLANLNSDNSAARIDVWNAAADKLQSVWDKIDSMQSHRDEDIAELLRFDREHLWHPYTSAVEPQPVVPITSAKNCTLYTADGSELIDGMASWWCVIHGYNHPALNEAVRQQLDKTAHVMFGGITHRGAVELARKILALAPKNMDRVFFADSGSVSVEAAMKMPLQYQQAQGQAAKFRLMTLRGGYHGDTLGAMSVCDPVNGMHTLFQGVLPKQIFAEKPKIPFHGHFCSDTAQAEIEQLEHLFRKYASETAAFILEPVVQGAGGMWFYHPEYLKHIRRLCNEYDILLIADEIATGFGRTGKMFAVEWAEIQPDIMCIGKALSGGYMTLAAVLTSRKVAEGISADGGVFMHGPTFTANPLACAAANASLDLLESARWKNDIARIENRLKTGLEPCRNNANAADVRILGGIGVVEMRQPVNTRRLQEFFVAQGVWIRPFGRLIYLMPPYCVTDGQLAQLTGAVCAAVEKNCF
ncbi:MAG: adenosylmethionine--8-amino-7-oxononanoate transaminase [Planctomycetaceae bacterium]|jgi:adenosylmethionine-8-amino-7-oxononanoate aminotransferase|nr:adenosylmethionine--8-amino-7-oxononanoate transaminase [Planctomycetaceae bacterium]